MGRPPSSKNKPKPKVKTEPKVKRKKKLSPEEKKRQLAVLRALAAQLIEDRQALMDTDPFWYFIPNVGTIDAEQEAFLREYLHEDDIPPKLTSQLDAFLSLANIVGVSGGNQVGKSVTGAIKGYIKATGELPYAFKDYADHPAIKRDVDRAKRKIVRGRVVGVDFKQLMNTVIPTWQQWCPRSYLKKGKWSDSFSMEHKTLSLYRKDKLCATIEFMTNKQDKESFQGPPLDWLSYDEEPRQDIHKENLLRFVTAERLDVGFFWTPTNGISWATELFDEETDKQGRKIELFKLCSVTNKKASIPLLRDILSEMDTYEEVKMRLLGEAVSLSGLVYGKLFDRSIHVVEPFFDDLAPSAKEDFLCLSGWDPHLVTASAGVFALVDREGIVYIDRCYQRNVDTEELKEDFTAIVKQNGYRMGWSVADKSSDSTITAFGGRNIFREISRGTNRIPGLRTSEKFEGSIKAGVDDIKKRLRNTPPRIFIVDRPENKVLINSFRTLERDTYADEDKQGPKDRIKEGKHHLHASMRYLFQYNINWYPKIDVAPEPEYFDEAMLW